jgi:uncharacterized protein YigA (DUF484 family)
MSEADIPTINDEIARKFRRIEAGLAARRSAAELFETLFAAIEGEFAIPFVWLSLLRLPETAGLRKNLEASPLLRDRLNIIGRTAFLEIFPDPGAPLLACGDLGPFFRLLPDNPRYFIRSLALSPLTLRGALIGSLNHGDSSPQRYEPGMDTALLMHLARSISENLARLLPPGENRRGPSLLT